MDHRLFFMLLQHAGRDRLAAVLQVESAQQVLRGEQPVAGRRAHVRDRGKILRQGAAGVLDGRAREWLADQGGFRLHGPLRRRRHAAEGDTGLATLSFCNDTANAPITAEMSWSKRRETL